RVPGAWGLGLGGAYDALLPGNQIVGTVHDPARHSSIGYPPGSALRTQCAGIDADNAGRLGLIVQGLNCRPLSHHRPRNRGCGSSEPLQRRIGGEVKRVFGAAVAVLTKAPKLTPPEVVERPVAISAQRLVELAKCNDNQARIAGEALDFEPVPIRARRNASAHQAG